MGGSNCSDASIQAFFSPVGTSPPTKALPSPLPSSDAPARDGFTDDEVKEALKLKPAQPWHPTKDYVDTDIGNLQLGPRAVSFMGRIANIFDVANTPKTPKSAKGCFKLCVKDDTGAITIRFWYAANVPDVRLGALVSIWTSHISNGENGTLSSLSAPMFASMFPERDRGCHLMLHDNSDDRNMCASPLGYRNGRPVSGVMTLQNFADGGYDVVDAKILVVVKSIGDRKTVNRKDGSSTENVSLYVHDDTGEATLGLWGTAAGSPFGTKASVEGDAAGAEATEVRQGWKAGETVLLIQAPGWKFGRNTYLSLTASSIVDVDPSIPDTEWLRRWSLRQKCREATNPPFPQGVFDFEAVNSGPMRCLFTLGELDEFSRAAPTSTFQGYLSLLIMEVKLLDCWRRRMLLSNECCNMPIYANATIATCKGCEKEISLRLNPRILGQVIDETGAVSGGKLLFSDGAWCDLLGRQPTELLKLGQQELSHLQDRLLFCRVTVMFGWTGDETKAGGRVCVMGVRA